jgi:hypothetical protein
MVEFNSYWPGVLSCALRHANRAGDRAMQILTVIIVIGLLATTGALLMGVVSMARGGEFDRRHSTELMFARVGLQALTLICLLIALFIVL